MAKCPKVRYRSKLDAKIALSRTQQSRASKREEARVYHCPNCKGWHLTSKVVWFPGGKR